jgi:hypothetical protein
MFNALLKHPVKPMIFRTLLLVNSVASTLLATEI